jgi:hypothetical protein
VCKRWLSVTRFNHRMEVLCPQGLTNEALHMAALGMTALPLSIERVQTVEGHEGVCWRCLNRLHTR